MNSLVDIEHFRVRLLALREDIRALQEARHEAADSVALDQSRVGRLSRMDAMQQDAMARSHQSRAVQTLRRIEAALARCDDGSYGICVGCDEAIATARLEFDPTVLRCVRCAEAAGR